MPNLLIIMFPNITKVVVDVEEHIIPKGVFDYGCIFITMEILFHLFLNVDSMRKYVSFFI
jgi:hypothetical protein